MMLIMAPYLLYDSSLPETAEKKENEENLMENGPHVQFLCSAVGLEPWSPSIKGLLWSCLNSGRVPSALASHVYWASEAS